MIAGRERASFAPIFLDGPAGRLFAIHYRPAPAQDRGADLVFLPPFAEEMNRSRRMVALAARALAAAGVGVLVLDLFGTGDSAGDFGDVRWATWQGDILAAAEWLGRHGREVLGLWGLRLGGLLAAEAAAMQPQRFPRLLLWQPVIDGKAMLTQFLRVRVAAAMSGAAERESTESLRADLQAGRMLEIAGYELSPELSAVIDASRLDACRLAAGTRVDWLEIGAEPAETLPPQRQNLVEDWRRQGVDVATAIVGGEPFWVLQETTLAPDLLAATGRLFAP